MSDSEIKEKYGINSRFSCGDMPTVDLSINVDDSLFTSTVHLDELPFVVEVLSRFGFCLIVHPIK